MVLVFPTPGGLLQCLELELSADFICRGAEYKAAPTAPANQVVDLGNQLLRDDYVSTFASHWWDSS